MGLESYLAVCLRGADGTHLGHLAVLDGRPMEADEDDLATLRIFASRAAAELERRRQAAALEASRTRAIEAADAERRRIGRDLHDGAQQRLMAVANFLTVARKNEAGRGAAARARRRASWRPRTPSCASSLAGSTRSRSPSGGSTARSSRSPPAVRFRSRSTCRSSSCRRRVALAAYFVVCESLVNAGRYAQANSAHVRASTRRRRAASSRSRDDGVGGADPADRHRSARPRGPHADPRRHASRSPARAVRERTSARASRSTPGSLASMAEPKRRLPAVRDVPWGEFRRRAAVAFVVLQAGWTALSAAEREEVRRLVVKSKGRPKSLTRDEARRLGRLAAKAARAAAASGRGPGRTRGTG